MSQSQIAKNLSHQGTTIYFNISETKRILKSNMENYILGFT